MGEIEGAAAKKTNLKNSYGTEIINDFIATGFHCLDFSFDLIDTRLNL